MLLGSAPLLIARGLTESLACRLELLHLPHWTFAEMRDAFSWSLDQYVFHGGYPGAAPLILACSMSREIEVLKHQLGFATGCRVGSDKVILLDSYVLLWVDIDDPTLGKSTRRLIAQAWEAGALAISAMSFWECAMLRVRRRIVLTQVPEHGAVTCLRGFLHKDPADRLVAATAITYGAIVVTADERLLKWKHAVKRQTALK